MMAVSSDGVSIHYETFGDGPTVVLAHGSLMEGRSWVEAGYVETLTGFRCVVMDCRGYGGSDKPHEMESYSTERYVDDILAVCGTERFAIAGYSFGTPGAWRAAHLYPERVAGLVAIGGWHPNLYSFGLDFAEKMRIEPMRAVGVHGIAEYMKREEGPLPEWWVDQVLASDPEAYIAQRYASVDWARVPPAEVRPPVLLISGSAEDPDRDTELVAASLPDGSALVVDGKGHCQAFLDPTTIEATTTFLRGLAPNAA